MKVLKLMRITRRNNPRKFIKRIAKFERLPFNKKMEYWITWHKPFEPSKEVRTYPIYCPSCGDENIKDNGIGFFRCRKEECGRKFIILQSEE